MRRKQREKRLKKEKKSSLGIFVLFFIVLILISFFVWIKVLNVPKFSFVNKTTDGGGEIVIVDGEKITKYKIEPETVFVSARGFGEYKLSSLWILGEKEGFGGQLVSESVTTNFLIPVYLWKNEKKTNLNLFQKLKVKTLNLVDNNYEKTLSNFELHNSVKISFTNNNIQESGILTEVEDLTGSPEAISKFSSIIDTLGTKISGYTKGYDKDLDCEVLGSDVDAVKLISNIFSCEIVGINESNNDLKIRLGAKFADRF